MRLTILSISRADIERQIQRFEAGFPAADLLADRVGVVGQVVDQLLQLTDGRRNDDDEEDDDEGQQ